jgi:2-haloacid dehalogenase
MRDLLTMTALAFDVFGTVVDWRGTILEEGAAWNRNKGLNVDWNAFALRWRAGYQPIMDRVRKGSLPWMKLDQLHRMLLDDLLPEFHIAELTEDEKEHLNLVWHRLKPWDDAVQGLTNLKDKYVLATLSNGNVSLLLEMAKRVRLHWDMILSAELFHHYKPDPEVYLGAAGMLGYRPSEIVMVAAHKSDLKAAKACGMKTAFVPRPMEYGEEREQAGGSFDIVALDFLDLAAQLT